MCLLLVVEGKYGERGAVVSSQTHGDGSYRRENGLYSFRRPKDEGAKNVL